MELEKTRKLTSKEKLTMENLKKQFELDQNIEAKVLNQIDLYAEHKIKHEKGVNKDL